ncbi:MAG: hypothetical protein KKB91_11165 [Proteobacteria bacterium]|jgi:hypothetical protein|nr:hypothetical protein [Desulfocapsa sp.]MBU3944626.1 hypothetical protein [Pseudomonadota bacterium]MCG2745048.1 hypothetical protein [Desulfobacteraceae bacterium]MBU3983246.1 hypothetical protein [Pseudomonadota bacterium]MBU4030246.1 hypothetical protein [Pseudomonadota bacterium]
MSGEMVLYGLSTLIVLLGGMSLILQKVYKVDSATGEKTTVEIPLFGKLSTNYPAVVFVFIGAALATYTLNKTMEVDDHWVVSGSFRTPNAEAINWERGNLRVSPKKYHMSVSPDGTFEIQGEIKKGRKFEEEVKQITYENCSCDGKVFGASIMAESEYNGFIKKEKSLIEDAGENTRRYKAVEVNIAHRQAQ